MCAIIALSSFLFPFPASTSGILISIQLYFQQVFLRFHLFQHQHTCYILDENRMLVTVIRQLDTPRISLKPLCIQSQCSRSFYSIASTRNVSDSVNGPQEIRLLLIVLFVQSPTHCFLPSSQEHANRQRRSFWEMKFRKQPFQARLSHTNKNLNEIFIESSRKMLDFTRKMVIEFCISFITVNMLCV